MEKKLYWLLEDNADLSVLHVSLPDCQNQIEAEFASLSDDDKLETQYTITPTYLTDEEYLELQEA